MRTPIILIASLSLLACTPTPANNGSICEALRPDMPVKFHGSSTDAETIANIRRANARFQAACPS